MDGPKRAEDGIRMIGRMIGAMTDIQDEGIREDLAKALLIVINDCNLYDIIGCTRDDGPREIAGKARAFFHGITRERMRAYTDTRSYAQLSELTPHRNLQSEQQIAAPPRSRRRTSVPRPKG